MECAVDLLKPNSGVTLNCSQVDQKQLIEYVMVHGDIDFKMLSAILGIKVSRLLKAATGEAALQGKQARRLVEFFLMFLEER
ncbi:hypothetical protein [Legionella sp. W05-934-2]|uniref:hypothetical protein n=1 Tax=Legionella sp. W05-934-2 TaxID=1198649 RepID=UPI003462AB3B